jgi:hypothetical protein
MTDTLTDLILPALSNQPNVEIAQTGQWDASTGRVTLTDDDFANAISALDCPAVRKPVLKIGHTDTRFNQVNGDGEPTVGWIDNMSVTDSGHTIVGDYTGMPGWLGPVLPSAYPDRSMEATWDFMCQLGHVHPFVITAVALLGTTPPAIGTLESLQDVANLYGVNMAASHSLNGNGFSVSVHASKGEPTMPNPRPKELAAGVTTEDIRRTYYETAPYSVWIKEFELDPLQLIVTDEADGSYARIPVTLENGEFTFGEAVPVEIEYVDKPEDTSTSTAASAGERIVYASKDESRPKQVKPAVKVETKLPPQEAIKRVHAASNSDGEPGRESGEMDPAKIREALGLSADASDDDVFTALAAARQTSPSTDPAPAGSAPSPAPAPVAASGNGVVVLDQSIVTAMQEDAEKGRQAFEEMRKNERDTIIAKAITEGKFAPARKEHWEKLWDADPDGTRAQISNLAKNLVPLQASGYNGGETYEQDEMYFGLYPEDRPERVGR